MSKLKVTSDWVRAANRLHGRNTRRRIVAYVESYDDVLFWRTVLSDFEDETRYFEVMLPTRVDLAKGKKKVIMSMLQEGGGANMIACVDADYDYLCQGMTYSSQAVLDNRYVFHTYVYAIENYQCYAPALHNVCVMATLNDHPIFDFCDFFARWSEIVYPLFVWNILLYRKLEYHGFTMTDFNHVTDLGRFSINNPMVTLEHLASKIDMKEREIRKRHPGMKADYEALKKELADLGVTPQTTYLYVQGHHVFDNVVCPIVSQVCERLRLERENEIRQKACHFTQRQNELSAYSNAQTDISQMMKKSTGYMRSMPFHQLQNDIQRFLDDTDNKEKEQAATTDGEGSC